MSPDDMSPGGSVNSSVDVTGWYDPSQRVLIPKMVCTRFLVCIIFGMHYSFFGVHHFLVCTRFLVCTIFGMHNSFFGVHHFLVCTRFLV